MNEEWIDKFLEKLAEHEGTEGRKVAIEGGKGTRGYGITTIAKGLINFLTLNDLNADEMSDKDLAKQIVIYNIDQIKNSIGEENWNKLPNSMKMVASDQYYNAGKLFPGFKKDLSDGNYLFNIGVGKGISIIDLANLIKDYVGWDGEFNLDTTKPEGVLEKKVDGSAK